VEAVEKRAMVQLKTRYINATILHTAFERLHIEPAGHLGIEPDGLIVCSQAIASERHVGEGDRKRR
jgi:hypothetical protein